MKNKSTRYYSDWTILKFFWVFIRPHSRLFGVACFVIPIISLFHLCQPLVIKYLVDVVLYSDSRWELVGLLLIFLILILGEFFLRVVQTFCLQSTGEKAVYGIRDKLFSMMIRRQMSFFDRCNSTEVTGVLTTDIEALSESFNSGLITLILDVLVLIGILIFMGFLNWRATLFFVCFLPILFLIVNFFRVRIRGLSTQVRSFSGKMTVLLEEQLSNVDTLQMYQGGKQHHNLFSELNASYARSSSQSAVYDAILYAVVESIFPLMSASFIFAYIHGMFPGLTIGSCIAFIDYISRFCLPLKDFSNKLATLQRALAAIEKIYHHYHDFSEESLEGAHLEGGEQEIIFENVHFFYKGYESKQVLCDISCSFRPGQMIALVGETGSGKSTIAKILLGFYRHYEGNIYFGNRELRTLSLTSIRSNIAFVLQETPSLLGNIAYNLTLDQPFQKENFARLYEKLGLYQIPYLKAFYEEGKEVDDVPSLSVGEQQILSVIRVLLSSKQWVILDEATAHLDSLTEKILQDAMNLLFKQKTVLVIAHRLSTIVHADHILVLKKGRIVEQGTHEELFSQGGYYTRLSRLRFDSLDSSTFL